MTPASDGAMSYRSTRGRKGGDICAIFVHAGAGYHSIQNEGLHLQACNDASKAAMAILRNGGTAVDAVEIAIKVLEDREITNAGYGSNLAMDGAVECDAIVVDHLGRSGAVGAVAQIKNPISLARLVLDHTTRPLLLKRVPPNLLVAQGATDFAFDSGMSVLPHDALVSPAARERWVKWRSDLKHAERKATEVVATPVSQPEYINDSWDPLEEEQERKRLRTQHTQTMLRGVSAITASTICPKSMYQHNNPSPASNNISASSGQSSLTSLSSAVSFIDNEAEESSFTEATDNPFINSTQTIPTISSFAGANSELKSSAPDITMSDAEDESDLQGHDDGERHRRRSGTWHDGSDEDSTSSTSSSGTMKLPSLTPSPTTLDAIGQPLPKTPSSEHPELLRMSTELRHVVEHAPLPPVPDSQRGSSHERESRRQKMQHLAQEPGQDHITDTVGAVAVDCYGNIACGASSGGIGMKYRGRVGPAALVGVGAAVVPSDPNDKDRVSVATVTSGTGEHMATTMAATVGAERLYHSLTKNKENKLQLVTEEEAIKGMIEKEFMGHPSVKHSNSAGAIGLMSVKKTRDGLYFYFAHNTDSFALASMHADEDRPTCTMSRSTGNGAIAQGGRCMRYKRKR